LPTNLSTSVSCYHKIKRNGFGDFISLTAKTGWTGEINGARVSCEPKIFAIAGLDIGTIGSKLKWKLNTSLT